MRSGCAHKVIDLAEAEDDGDLLAGVHGHLAAYMAAQAGSADDQQVRLAIDEVRHRVEQAQSRGGFIDESVSEYRATAQRRAWPTKPTPPGNSPSPPLARN